VADAAEQDTAEKKKRALDPERSFVVVSCAGSGKTWMLISRIVRALLAGARPEDILAITFTRKATAEIEERVRAQLALFANADDERLGELLGEIGARDTPKARARAHEIHKAFLLSDRGMTIRTFDSWFQQLLRSGPWLPDARRAPKLSDNPKIVLKDAWESLMSESDPDGPFGRAMIDLMRENHLQIESVKKVLEKLIDRRDLWMLYAAQEDPLERACDDFDERAGAGHKSDPIAQLLGSKEFVEGMRALSEVGLGDPKERSTCIEVGERLKEALDGDMDARDRYQKLIAALHTDAGKLRAAVDKILHLIEETPDIMQAIDELRRTDERLKANEASKFNRRALTAATAWLGRYQKEKEDRGEDDYTDITIDAWRLITGEGDSEKARANAAALQYKMDRAYRHILVDEFQDTNPLQWEILRTWLVAVEQEEDRPQVFIVGDPKQSIYRFRGGDPNLLNVARDFLEKRWGAETIQIDETRRCAPKLVDAINRVFIDGELIGDYSKHVPSEHNMDLPGRVELLLSDNVKPEKEQTEGEDGFRDPLTTPRREIFDSGEEARLVAKRLREVKRDWKIRGEDGLRPCRWDDIMVLYAQRTEADQLEAALRAEGIPCAAQRRGGLSSLECADVMAAMGFVINPANDMALLQVLRSPLFGASPEDLADLAMAQHRLSADSEGKDTGLTMWKTLLESASLSPRLDRARDLLGEWRKTYLTVPLPAHDFLSRLYSEGEALERYSLAVPEKLRARVRDNLVRLLHLALQLDKGRRPQLPLFLRTLKRMRQEAVESDPSAEDLAPGEVELLTIHAAKGLERPVVFVFDTGRPFGKSRGQGAGGELYWDWPPDRDRPALVALGLSNKKMLPNLLTELSEREDEAKRQEWNNTLYVALTRASQAVVLSAEKDSNGDVKGWSEHVCNALMALGVEGSVAGGTLRWGDDLTQGEIIDGATEQRSPARVPEPSHTKIGEPKENQNPAQLRGELLHAILAMRLGAGDDPEIARKGIPAESRAQFEELWESSDKMLVPLRERGLLSPDTRRACEVAISAAQDDGESEQRRIDCLIEKDGELWVIDFKSGDMEAHMDEYREQLGRYREILLMAHPDAKIRCALVGESGEMAILGA